MVFNIFTKLYNHHHYLTSEHFQDLRKELQDFPGDTVVGSPPASAGDTG